MSHFGSCNKVDKSQNRGKITFLAKSNFVTKIVTKVVTNVTFRQLTQTLLFVTIQTHKKRGLMAKNFKYMTDAEKNASIERARIRKEHAEESKKLREEVAIRRMENTRKIDYLRHNLLKCLIEEFGDYDTFKTVPVRQVWKRMTRDMDYSQTEFARMLQRNGFTQWRITQDWGDGMGRRTRRVWRKSDDVPAIRAYRLKTPK